MSFSRNLLAHRIVKLTFEKNPKMLTSDQLPKEYQDQCMISSMSDSNWHCQIFVLVHSRLLTNQSFKTSPQSTVRQTSDSNQIFIVLVKNNCRAGTSCQVLLWLQSLSTTSWDDSLHNPDPSDIYDIAKQCQLCSNVVGLNLTLKPYWRPLEWGLYITIVNVIIL